VGDLAHFPGGFIYGQEVGSGGPLEVIDPVSVSAGVVGNDGIPGAAITFRGDGVLFGASQGNLYTIDPSSGAKTEVATLNGPNFPGMQPFVGIKFDDSGTLFLLNHNILYTVDTGTGSTLLVGATGFTLYDITYASGQLYGATTDGRIVHINTNTGASQVIATEAASNPIDAIAAGGVSPSTPVLGIASTYTNTVVLYWIAPSNTFGLQQKLVLTETNWTSVTNSVIVSNSLNQVVLPLAGSSSYFQLVRL
jgi:hypothetical protein